MHVVRIEFLWRQPAFHECGSKIDKSDVGSLGRFEAQILVDRVYFTVTDSIAPERNGCDQIGNFRMLVDDVPYLPIIFFEGRFRKALGSDIVRACEDRDISWLHFAGFLDVVEDLNRRKSWHSQVHGICRKQSEPHSPITRTGRNTIAHKDISRSSVMRDFPGNLLQSNEAKILRQEKQSHRRKRYGKIESRSCPCQTAKDDSSSAHRTLPPKSLPTNPGFMGKDAIEITANPYNPDMGGSIEKITLG